jgi:5'-deoxynucleotidase YfbR-like HD superfamily hydrolase
MRAIKDIETKLNQLTPELIQELERYLDYLINKRISKRTRRLKQDWAGGLKGEKYSSIDLQKKALDWRQK